MSPIVIPVWLIARLATIKPLVYNACQLLAISRINVYAIVGLIYSWIRIHRHVSLVNLLLMGLFYTLLIANSADNLQRITQLLGFNVINAMTVITSVWAHAKLVQTAAKSAHLIPLAVLA
jgi:hypothetical protein